MIHLYCSVLLLQSHLVFGLLPVQLVNVPVQFEETATKLQNSPTDNRFSSGRATLLSLIVLADKYAIAYCLGLFDSVQRVEWVARVTRSCHLVVWWPPLGIRRLDFFPQLFLFHKKLNNYHKIQTAFISRET